MAVTYSPSLNSPQTLWEAGYIYAEWLEKVAGVTNLGELIEQADEGGKFLEGINYYHTSKDNYFGGF